MRLSTTSSIEACRAGPSIVWRCAAAWPHSLEASCRCRTPRYCADRMTQHGMHAWRGAGRGTAGMVRVTARCSADAVFWRASGRDETSMRQHAYIARRDDVGRAEAAPCALARAAFVHGVQSAARRSLWASLHKNRRIPSNPPCLNTGHRRRYREPIVS